jgi:hypothetical protein
VRANHRKVLHPHPTLSQRKRVLRESLVIATALMLATVAHGVATADVIVLANRTGVQLPVRFSPTAGRAQQLTLPAGAVLPLFLDGKAQVDFASRGGPKRYTVDANCAYFFGRAADGRIDMQKIGLGENASAGAGRDLPGSAIRAPLATIAVKIPVDEEEPARQVHWERRLRSRIQAASAILEQYCRVRLNVVAVGTWNSDNTTNDFIAALAEFEREATPAPARLAIGFTSQWTMVRGRTHMAGTRGPLHSHILVREGSPQISEPERLEFLVHELGHHLGATHSPERTSVMRPVLGDDLAGRSDYRIQFDPVNTLVIAMIGEEIRRRNITRMYDLTAGSKRRLRQIYTALGRSLPEDSAAARYIQLMGTAADTPLAGAAQHVLQEMVRAAAANQALPSSSSEALDGPTRRVGDELTEYYVRQAARAAGTLPEDAAARAFLVAIGIGLGDSQLLARLPGAGDLARAAESPTERAARVTISGEPTMLGRRDLAQHFFVSAYLTAAIGVQAANTAGLAKEMLDAQGASGLSFADIAADRAGVRFADGLLNKRVPLGLLPQTFTVDAFLPEVEGLPEAVSADLLKSQYGGQNDPRFRQQLVEIDERILALPPYRPLRIQISQ